MAAKRLISRTPTLSKITNPVIVYVIFKRNWMSLSRTDIVLRYRALSKFQQKSEVKFDFL